ncbi:hypothetical protein V6N11_033253 [Hibiscus sabdariffa]|uniref:Reverse transcriptase zinc-binding domain-containing protein n=1 Tax=Hibiscus sabdariffa TaxID=183260 RepID=A0ABR2PXL9_9ROSI
MRHNLTIQVGDGKSVFFWTDLWIGDFALKDKFPRIFALSRNKSGFLVDFGFKVGLDWNWSIPLRRPLFDWEKLQWNNLLECLNNFKPSNTEHDWVRWFGSSDGSFSVKSLRLLIGPNRSGESMWNECVWIGFTPPKVEIFVWLVLWGRVPVKMELSRRGMSNLGCILCPLCKLFPESVSHLFFSCSGIWPIWMYFCRLLGISTVLPREPKLFFEAWGALGDPNHKEWFLVILFVVLWSIWLFRNEVIFQNKKVDWLQLNFLIRFRLAYWHIAKFPGCFLSLDCLMTDFSLTMSPKRRSSCPTPTPRWVPPPIGFLKLNIDGAVSLCLKGGIDGLLRDEKGSILFQFS